MRKGEIMNVSGKKKDRLEKSALPACPYSLLVKKPSD